VQDAVPEIEEPAAWRKPARPADSGLPAPWRLAAATGRRRVAE